MPRSRTSPWRDGSQGHLLLEHGDIDDNVHPVETIRFVDALMKANKNFDMLLCAQHVSRRERGTRVVSGPAAVGLLRPISARGNAAG